MSFFAFQNSLKFRLRRWSHQSVRIAESCDSDFGSWSIGQTSIHWVLILFMIITRTIPNSRFRAVLTASFDLDLNAFFKSLSILVCIILGDFIKDICRLIYLHPQVISEFWVDFLYPKLGYQVLRPRCSLPSGFGIFLFSCIFYKKGFLTAGHLKTQ